MRTCEPDGLDPTRRRQDERHLHDLVVERRAVHVVRPRRPPSPEALAPRLAVIGEEREDRLLAEPETLELLEERRDERLRLALDRLAVGLARRLERRGGVAWMPAMTSCFAARQSLRSECSTVYGMCVAQLWKNRRNGFSRRSRSQAIAPSSVSLVRARSPRACL